MRAKTFALALAGLMVLPAAARADAVADCNSDKPDTVIQGCTQIIKEGKASKDAIAVAYFNRANAFDDNGDHDGAILDYTQAIKLKPNYVDSYFNRGLASEEKKDYDKAIADYEAAIKISPQYAKAYYGRARALEAKGDLKEALAGFEQVLTMAPGNKAVLQKIAEIKQKLGQ